MGIYGGWVGRLAGRCSPSDFSPLRPLVPHLSSYRWFCEGRELHDSPDIQISSDGVLHALVISEAFEDDTGRYTCIASNCLGADNTSAEVYIEGRSPPPPRTRAAVLLQMRHLKGPFLPQGLHHRTQTERAPRRT